MYRHKSLMQNISFGVSPWTCSKHLQAGFRCTETNWLNLVKTWNGLNIKKVLSSTSERNEKARQYCCLDPVASWDYLFRFSAAIWDFCDRHFLMKYGCLNIFTKWKDKFKVGSRVYFICIWLSVCLPEEITTPLQGPSQKFRSPCHSICFPFPPSSNIFNESAHPDLPLCLPTHLVVFRFSLPPVLVLLQVGFISAFLAAGR